jgi:uncharacterized protein YaiE (UPF0345 family)
METDKLKEAVGIIVSAMLTLEQAKADADAIIKGALELLDPTPSQVKSIKAIAKAIAAEKLAEVEESTVELADLIAVVKEGV